MRPIHRLALTFTLVLTMFLTAMAGIRRNDAALASRIAPEILRFHVLANSDSPEDQAVKLQVKELLLNEINEGLAKEAAAETEAAQETKSGQDSRLPDAQTLTKSQVIAYILENKTALEETADALLSAQGFSYTADLRLETTEFPEKTYGDMTFPAGIYDAVRVLLGAGEGKNFWCVLYPTLCYLDSTHAVVPDESKELLKTLIPEDDFLSLLTARKGTALGNFRENQDSRRDMTDFAGEGENREPGSEKRAGEPRLKIRFKFYEMVKLPFTAQS